MSERILILGNLGNAGFQVTEQLVKAGHDVTLGVNTLDFGMSMPEWELLNFDKPIDPYNQNDCQELQQYWTPPKWIRYFQFDMNLIKKRPKRIIRKISRCYFDKIGQGTHPFCRFNIKHARTEIKIQFPR